MNTGKGALKVLELKKANVALACLPLGVSIEWKNIMITTIMLGAKYSHMRRGFHLQGSALLDEI